MISRTKTFKQCSFSQASVRCSTPMSCLGCPRDVAGMQTMLLMSEIGLSTRFPTSSSSAWLPIGWTLFGGAAVSLGWAWWLLSLLLLPLLSLRLGCFCLALQQTRHWLFSFPVRFSELRRSCKQRQLKTFKVVSEKHVGRSPITRRKDVRQAHSSQGCERGCEACYVVPSNLGRCC